MKKFLTIPAALIADVALAGHGSKYACKPTPVADR
jgi:hypothetical protein